MSYDLIVNGVNFTLGLLGTTASIASYASGFSLEKDIKQISKSISRLDDISEHIREVSDESKKSNTLLNNISQGLPLFSSNDFTQQQLCLYNLTQNFQMMQSELTNERKLIIETLNEMREIVQSIKYTQSNRKFIPPSFANKILNNPFQAGIHLMTPFDIPFISNQKIENRIINANTSPIVWNNYYGQTFYGSISKNTLYDNDIRLNLPTYVASVDGHIYSEKCGLYLPHIMV